MKDKKMTDSEIVKEFTEKTELIGSMSSVYLDEDKGLELYMAMSNILILINRLQAENEKNKGSIIMARSLLEQKNRNINRLEEENRDLKEEIESLLVENKDLILEIQSLKECEGK